MQGTQVTSFPDKGSAKFGIWLLSFLMASEALRKGKRSLFFLVIDGFLRSCGWIEFQ